jgi:hypothetical protein
VFDANPNQLETFGYRDHKWGKLRIPEIRILCKSLFSNVKILHYEYAAEEIKKELIKYKNESMKNGEVISDCFFGKHLKDIYNVRQKVGEYKQHTNIAMKTTDKLTIKIGRINQDLNIKDDELYLTLH